MEQTTRPARRARRLPSAVAELPRRLSEVPSSVARLPGETVHAARRDPAWVLLGTFLVGLVAGLVLRRTVFRKREEVRRG